MEATLAVPETPPARVILREVSMADAEQPQDQRQTGRKRFKDVESLWDALEKYHHYHDGAIIRKTNGRGGQHGGEGLGIQITDEWAEIMVANQAIDRAMVRLGVIEPRLHLLLHHYYRRGLCEDAGGWLEAANKAGLILTRKERFARGAFDWLLERAVWVLFACHRARRRGW
jgi:hypothetical protein